ncbi:protein of unknown function DUF456 [Chloroherpeton thalassium ATCC 35110]|uniref:DUF456 domain-containing protein n=1 Tax=Chloroherpeton thalassium (strain ATCC 35110 / GB-78) TaxID=517418 RepID=B3QWC7_CHLT3|nr:DUF456 family protein [Chloroherpeton thalassium]ACF13240.1 protein of unknown function DUF456 [Chloroherpeton thalassium ATCC 35110]
MDSMVLLWILSVVLMVAGFVGLIVPALPGPPLLFVGMLIGAWAEDFAHIGWVTLLILFVLMLLTYGADFMASAYGAKRYGASNRAMLGSAIGGIVGLFFGLPGVLLGPFIGAVLGELSLKRNLNEAGRAGFGATLGLVLGAAAKIALAFTMLGVFLIARFVS